MNILSLLPVGEYRYKCPGEYAGPCPWCGGEDRFIIFAGQGVDGLGRFWCRQCDKGGDAIQFLREFKGMSYRAACEALQVEPRQDNATQTIKQATTSQHWKPEPERIPSEVWQRRALCFYFECQARLSTQAGQEALQFRGLNIDFARRHGLGWNPADQYDDPAAWGLEPWLNDKGNPGKVALPAGLVIFTKRKDRTVAVKIRRHNWQPDDNWPKYHAVRGGGNGAYVLGKRDLPVVLVESELDALLIAQETSELCSVVALPAGNRPDAQTAAFLRAAPDILYAGDFDEAGKKAFGWWREHFPTCRAWPPVVGKDPTEMHMAGIPILTWLNAVLAVKIAPRMNWSTHPTAQNRVPELLPSAKTIEAYRESVLTVPAATSQAPVAFPVGSSICEPSAPVQPQHGRYVPVMFHNGTLEQLYAALPPDVLTGLKNITDEAWRGFYDKGSSRNSCPGQKRYML